MYDEPLICERCEEDYVMTADWQDECYCEPCYRASFQLGDCDVC